MPNPRREPDSFARTPWLPPESGQRAGRIAADIDPADAAALVIAASDGLQIQWLLDPDVVDAGRSLAILERLLPGDPGFSARA